MSSTMTTIEDDVKAIEASAASLKAKQAVDTRQVGSASVGDTVRQGDLYLVCLGPDPGFAKKALKKNRDMQLAPGTTQGSRHVLENGLHFDVDKAALATAIKAACKRDVPVELIGGLIQANKGPCTIAHPEHAHRILPEGDYWAVVFQRQYAEDVRRVQD